jgi:uncharacterized protein DUF2332
MAQDPDDPVAIARRYERFAMAEARGVSPIYEQLATAVAGSSELLSFLSSVPSERRQPNLFLAAVRHVGGVPRNGKDVEEIVRAHGRRIRQVIADEDDSDQRARVPAPEVSTCRGRNPSRAGKERAF